MDIQETIKGYIEAVQPDIEQRLISVKRLEICETCENKSEYKSDVGIMWKCEVCGCGNIIHSSHKKEKGMCPLDKWRDIENQML